MTLRRWWLALGPLLMVIGFVYAVFLFPYVQTFHIRGDDFALILHSARQYHPNAFLWIARGYSSYFDSFSELPHYDFGLCRPVVNATFWLESLLSPGTGPLNLTTNYLGLAITLVLFVFFVHRETSNNILFLSSMLIVYAFSPMWHMALTAPGFRCPVPMVLFALAAFLLLPPEGSRHQGLRITLSILCQLASLLSQEIGVATPVIAALLFVVTRDGKLARGRLKLLPLFLLPLVCFATLRLVFYGGMSRSWVLEPEHGWVRLGIASASALLTKPFFPWDPPLATEGQRTLAVVLAALMNLAGYALVAYALLRSGKAGRTPLSRVLLCLVVALGVLWTSPGARYMELAAVFGALATIVAAEQISRGAGRPWVRKGVALGLVGLAAGQLLIYLTTFRQMAVGSAGWGRRARVEFEGVQKAIATASVPTLLLVNDQAAGAGSGAMLEMAAWPNRGPVRRLIPVDTLFGEGSPQSSLRISRDNGAVRIEIVAGQGQAFALGNAYVSHLGSGFVNQGLNYEMDAIRSYSVTARVLRHLGKKVEPDNVSIGRRLVVTVPAEMARAGVVIVGFDPRDMSWFSKELPR
jgi:hypothetical protein